MKKDTSTRLTLAFIFALGVSVIGSYLAYRHAEQAGTHGGFESVPFAVFYQYVSTDIRTGVSREGTGLNPAALLGNTLVLFVPLGGAALMTRRGAKSAQGSRSKAQAPR